jgi:hypothetical protein
VDPVTGLVGETWYARIPGSNQAAFYGAFSDSGGRTFSTPVRISDGVSIALFSNPGNSRFHLGYGDYSGNAFYDDLFYPSWADNSNSTGNNPDGKWKYLDVYTARIRVLRTHPARPHHPAPGRVAGASLAAIGAGHPGRVRMPGRSSPPVA